MLYTDLIWVEKLSKQKFTEQGIMILDKGWKDVGIKVVDTICAANSRMVQAYKEGKFVLLLPGTYDIFHAGHVSWLYEAVENFLSELNDGTRKYSRDDIYVVIPFDNDDLTKVAKKYKHKYFGGTEEVVRPVVQQDIRALALANLDCVDLVVPVPSPLTIDRLLEQPKTFSVGYAQRLLKSLEKNGFIDQKNYFLLSDSLSTYKRLISSDFNSVQKYFGNIPVPNNLLENIYSEYIPSNEVWNEIAWQISVYLNIEKAKSESSPNMKNKYSRILSKRDEYDQEALCIMKIAGISIISILDKYILSTSQIIKDSQEKHYNILDLLSDAKLI